MYGRHVFLALKALGYHESSRKDTTELARLLKIRDVALSVVAEEITGRSDKYVE